MSEQAGTQQNAQFAAVCQVIFLHTSFLTGHDVLALRGVSKRLREFFRTNDEPTKGQDTKFIKKKMMRMTRRKSFAWAHGQGKYLMTEVPTELWLQQPSSQPERAQTERSTKVQGSLLDPRGPHHRPTPSLESQLLTCSYCKRQFFQNRISRHEEVCRQEMLLDPVSVDGDLSKDPAHKSMPMARAEKFELDNTPTPRNMRKSRHERAKSISELQGAEADMLERFRKLQTQFGIPAS